MIKLQLTAKRPVAAAPEKIANIHDGLYTITKYTICAAKAHFPNDQLSQKSDHEFVCRTAKWPRRRNSAPSPAIMHATPITQNVLAAVRCPVLLSAHRPPNCRTATNMSSNKTVTTCK